MPEINQTQETIATSKHPEPGTVFTSAISAVGESLDIDFWTLLVEARIIT